MAKRPERYGVQLAYPAEEKRIQKLGKHFICQPKLNGERARVEWFQNEPYLLSSYGNVFPFLEHIKDALLHLGHPHQLDGEIYVHGWSRERIDAALRTRKHKHPDNELLEFHIFDTVNLHIPQGARIQLLDRLDLGYGPLKKVYTDITNIETWKNDLYNYIDNGYEGIILRDFKSPYSIKRTTSMLKFKPSEKDDYTIVGVKPGTGWCEGMLGAFEVASTEEINNLEILGPMSWPESLKTFFVGTGPELTKEKRIYYWSIRGDLIGKTLTVKHEKLKTSGGIPLCTVAYKVNL
jgi:ATP-dependent DNA ligase